MISKLQFSCWVLGATALAAAVGSAAKHHPLQNPGFENGFAAWRGAERFKGEVAIVAGDGRTDRQCLRISMLETSTRLPGVHQRLTGLEPGATYRFSAWARGVKGEEGTAVKLKLDFYNARGEITSIHPAVMAVEGGEPWRPFNVIAIADTDAVVVDAIVTVTGAGMADLDDIHFEKIAERPTLRVSSAMPLGIDPDSPGRVQLNASFKEPYRDKALPSFEMEIDGAAVGERSEVHRVDGCHFVLQAVLPPLAPGTRWITVSSGDQKAAEPIRVEVAPRDRKPLFLGDSGEHRRGNKIFFPIGIYNVEHSEEEYAALIAHGFNMIQGKFPGNLEDFTKSLDLALRYGIAVDVPLYAGGRVAANISKSLELFRQVGGHPAVLCWKIFDEPDADQNVAVREEVPQAYAALKAAKMRQPLELTLCQESTFGYWSRFCDSVQVDRYPLPGGSVSEVYDACVKAKEVMQPWQNLTFVLQCGWTSDLKTQPTVTQARAMVYLALIGGARGISWYSKRETNWDLTVTPLWSHLAAINAEISTLARPLLLGREVVVQSDNDAVRLCARSLDGRLYLLLCNPGDGKAQVTLTIPELPVEAQWSTVTAMDSPSRKWVVKNGVVRLTLNPLESLTMLLNLEQSSALNGKEGGDER